MLKTKLYNIQAVEIGEVELNESVFGVEYNEALIHQVVVAQLANKRQGTKSTLTRAEVRGGGIKPWRQKGTGRARQGSIRAPQWIKGGVVFAPKPRDFSQKINKLARRTALKSALSKKIADGEIIVIDDIVISAPKTKEVATILKNFGLDKRVLMVIDEHNADMVRASRNIANLTICEAALLNVYDVVANTKCVMSKAAIKKIEEALA
ncbi:MAG: 50S ribosomal protein L4 [Clostridia bacterium]|nr:50S ribosomal protein L4 [Clostridia bacterium]MBR7159808.1 50S ribosomal protein L4 [Clostridia bacterium]